MKKEDKARFLFEELGNIDDDLLYESSGKPLTILKTKRKRQRRAAILAAALVAVVSVMLITVAANRPSGNDVAPSDQTTSPDYSTSPDHTEPLPLDGDGQRQAIFGGRPVILYTEGDAVYAKTVTEDDLSSLLSAMKDGAPVGNGRKALRKVWISDGKGRVTSPLLKRSAGNVVYGTLFSYEQELALTEQLEKKLEALTGTDF